MTSLHQWMAEMMPAVEEHLKREVAQVEADLYHDLRYMLEYHMGWEGPGAGPDAQGKRIRPLLVLLCCQAAGSEWRKALPVAAAVELLHNFSLIHDDIQDQSPQRRGRNALWVDWGIAQAINAGDLMFSLANQSVLSLVEHCTPSMTVKIAKIFQRACIDLTHGQFLDISYERETELPLEAYWPMITNKTAVLIGTCCEMGSLLGGAASAKVRAYRNYGLALGLAFQTVDDWLGIWGDAQRTGKSIESDLVSGKKTYPVLHALKKKGAFTERWRSGPINPEEVVQLAELLKAEGAYEATLQEADRLTHLAKDHLSRACPEPLMREVLLELTDLLLRRDN